MLSDDDRALIYEQIATQKAATAATQRQAKAIEIRNAVLVQISEDTARLIEQLKTHTANYQTLAGAIAAGDEKLEDLHARQGVIDRAVKLILELERAQIANVKNAGQRRELEQKINEAQSLSLDAAAIKRRINKQASNLNYLQEQAATYGGRVPLDLINQITDVQDVIQELQGELKREEE